MENKNWIDKKVFISDTENDETKTEFTAEIFGYKDIGLMSVILQKTRIEKNNCSSNRIKIDTIVTTEKELKQMIEEIERLKK